MQRNCSKCGNEFEPVNRERYYCSPCQSAYNKAWEAEHRRKLGYVKTYRPKQMPKNRITAMQQTQETVIYCPACGKRTRHVLYSAQSKAIAARWQCQRTGCKRVRVVSAAELREAMEEVS